MLDADGLTANDDPDDVESKGVTRTLEARYPYFRGAAELALFAPTHRCYWTTERIVSTCLHFHESDRSLDPAWNFAGCDQVDVAVPILESPPRDLPTMDAKPLLRDSLSLQTESLLLY